MVFANYLGLIIFSKPIIQLDLFIKDFQKDLDPFFMTHQELVILIFAVCFWIVIFLKTFFHLDLFVKDIHEDHYQFF